MKSLLMGHLETLVGTRVAICPASDIWMQGIRYGTIKSIGRKWVHLVSDSNHKFKMHPFDLDIEISHK